ncbi:MAG: metal-dependent hydrolase [Nitrososphaeria archaeon]
MKLFEHTMVNIFLFVAIVSVVTYYPLPIPHFSNFMSYTEFTGMPSTSLPPDFGEKLTEFIDMCVWWPTIFVKMLTGAASWPYSATMQLGVVYLSWIIFIAASGVPDLDSEGGNILSVVLYLPLTFLLWALKKIAPEPFRHRGAAHSIFYALLASAVNFLLMYLLYVFVVRAIGVNTFIGGLLETMAIFSASLLPLCYLGHILFDTSTESGVRLFYPLSNKVFYGKFWPVFASPLLPFAYFIIVPFIPRQETAVYWTQFYSLFPPAFALSLALIPTSIAVSTLTRKPGKSKVGSLPRTVDTILQADYPHGSEDTVSESLQDKMLEERRRSLEKAEAERRQGTAMKIIMEKVLETAKDSGKGEESLLEKRKAGGRKNNVALESIWFQEKDLEKVWAFYLQKNGGSVNRALEEFKLKAEAFKKTSEGKGLAEQIDTVVKEIVDEIAKKKVFEEEIYRKAKEELSKMESQPIKQEYATPKPVEQIQNLLNRKPKPVEQIKDSKNLPAIRSPDLKRIQKVWKVDVKDMRPERPKELVEGGFYEDAYVSAFSLLEYVLKKNMKMIYGDFRAVLDKMVEEEKISSTLKERISQYYDIRNGVVHSGRKVSFKEVREFVNFVYDVLEGQVH